MALQEVSDVIGNYMGLSRKVLEYSQIMKRLVDSARQPGFSVESWAPLVELVAIDEFERVGNFKEVEPGFDTPTAQEEAKRCLRCDLEWLDLMKIPRPQ